MKFATYVALIATANAQDDVLRVSDAAPADDKGTDHLEDCNTSADCTPIQLPLGPQGSVYPVQLTQEQTACATWSRYGVAQSKCIPVCSCGLDTLAGTDADGEFYQPMVCTEDNTEEGDGCQSLIKGNTAAFLTCEDDGCEVEGEKCGFLPYMDWGVFIEYRPDVLNIDTSICIPKESCDTKDIVFGTEKYWCCDDDCLDYWGSDFDAAGRIVAGLATIALMVATIA